MKAISVINHKGGVGKTTIVVNLASAIARLGLNALVIDLDPQANASLLIGKSHPSQVKVTSYDLLLNDDPQQLNAAIHTDTTLSGVSLIYGSIRLAGIEESLRARSIRPAEHLAAYMQYLHGIYDIVLVDCPPALNLLTSNALAACNYYVVPLMTGDQFGLYGADDLDYFVQRIRAANRQLELLGVILMQHDRRQLVCRTIADSIQERYRNIFSTTISRGTAVQQSILLNTSIVEMDSEHKVSREFRALARELLQKAGVTPPKADRSKSALKKQSSEITRLQEETLFNEKDDHDEIE